MFGSSIFGAVGGSGSNSYEYGAGGGAHAGGTATATFLRAERQNIEEALRTYLLTKSEVTDLVGQRIYPDYRPQKSALPAIVYTLGSKDSGTSLYAGTGILRASITLHCMSGEHRVSRKVADVLRVILDGNRDQWGDVEVCRTRHEDDSTEFVEDPAGADKGVFVVSAEFGVKYRGTRPVAAASIP